MNGGDTAVLDNICFGRVFEKLSPGQVFWIPSNIPTFSPNLPNQISCFLHGSFFSELSWSYLWTANPNSIQDGARHVHRKVLAWWGWELWEKSRFDPMVWLPAKNTGDLEIVPFCLKKTVHAYKEAGENPV